MLAEGAVRHVGDPVAFIVADTIKQARDAAEAIEVDYDILPSITELATAMDKGGTLVWPEVPHNLAFDWEIGDKAATEAEFAKAAHVTKLTIVNNRIVVNSIEARAALADFDAQTGRWTLYANTQGGWLVKNLIGPLFGTDPEKFRIVTPDVGGGFGMKLFLYAEHVLTCYAARKLGRPVKWAAERGEAFLCDTQGRDNLTTGELAIDADGKFLALRTRNVSNMGAYLSTFAPYIPTYAGTGVLSSVYGFKAIYANVLGVFTNTVPVDAYRGAGRPESNYLVERLVDAAARELKIDKVELRRRNMVLPDAMPHATPVGKSYDSGDFRIVLDAATKNMDYAGFAGPQGRRGGARQAPRPRPRLLPGSNRRRSRPNARRSASPMTASSTSMSAPNPPARATRPPTSSSPPTTSASTATRSASARATPTPSRSAAAPAALAACIPRARPSC